MTSTYVIAGNARAKRTADIARTRRVPAPRARHWLVLAAMLLALVGLPAGAAADAPPTGQFVTTGDPCPAGWTQTTAGTFNGISVFSTDHMNVSYYANGPLNANTRVTSSCTSPLPIVRATVGGFISLGSTSLYNGAMEGRVTVGTWSWSNNVHTFGDGHFSFRDVDTGGGSVLTATSRCDGDLETSHQYCSGADDWSAYANIIAAPQSLTLADDFAPSASVVAAPAGDWRKVVSVHIDATDPQPASGLKTAQLVIDGTPRATVDLSAGTSYARTCADRGAKTFSAVKPCPPTASAPIDWDSRELSDGTHNAAVVVTDASGRSATVADWPRTITIHNAPILQAAPNVAGTTKVGETVSADTGQWDGSPTSYSYQWFADDQPIAGATDPSYAIQPDDAYKTFKVNVTAHNPSGVGTTDVETSTVVDEDGFTVPTSPANLAAPGITGSLRVGTAPAPVATLGSWRDASSYDVTWFRCEPEAVAVQGDGKCSPLSNSSAGYSLTTDDQYHRLAVRVVAHNHRRAATVFSAVTAIVRDVDGNTRRPAGGRTLDPVSPRNPVAPRNDLPPGVPGRVVPDWPGGVTNLTNPLASTPGHAANGNGASAAARFTKVQVKNGRKLVAAVRGKANRRWTVTGTLTDGHGTGIGNALVTAVAREPQGSWSAGAIVRTSHDGSFRFRSRSATSQEVRFAYFAFSDDRSVMLSSAVALGAYAPATLSFGRRGVHSGQTLPVSGTVAGANTVPGGLLVHVELWQAGFGWNPVGQARTDASGHWTLRYQTRAGLPPHRVKLRAVIARQGAWPYLTTTSPARGITIG